MFRQHTLVSTVFVLSIAASACGGRTTSVQPGSTTPTSATMPQTTPATSAATDGTLAAGASLMVRLIDPISSDSTREGAPFQAVLASPINDASGKELVPANAKVFGRVVEASGGGAIKKPRLTITLTEIDAPGHKVPIATTTSGAEGGHGGAVKKIGAGTLIGAAAGSAGAGAAVGGAAVLLSGKNAIVIQPGTLVEFQLTQAARIK